MELDRLRYSLSKYLRTRLRKVERDALHVLAVADGEMDGRLSDRCVDPARESKQNFCIINPMNPLSGTFSGCVWS